MEVEKLKEEIQYETTIQEVRKLFVGIEDGARRTSEIVKGLRNFSRLDQNVFRKTNLNECFESTLTLLHSSYKNRIEIIRDYADLPEVDCFPGQINQVFMNILSNAVQSIPETGRYSSSDRPLGDIEKKLLALRRQRPQPGRDEKILCGTNALAACALVQAARLLDRPEWEQRAAAMVRRLLELFWDGSTLSHSLARGAVQKQAFLGDAAALLLAVTMLRESDDGWQDPMNALAGYTASFRSEDRWFESDLADFQAVPASWFDHPVPSSVSLAEMGLARAAVLGGGAPEGGTPERLEYRQPQQSDFYNVAAMFSQGLFHQVHSKNGVAWPRLPANAIQVRDDAEMDCYMSQCRPLAF